MFSSRNTLITFLSRQKGKTVKLFGSYESLKLYADHVERLAKIFLPILREPFAYTLYQKRFEISLAPNPKTYYFKSYYRDQDS